MSLKRHIHISGTGNTIRQRKYLRQVGKVHQCLNPGLHDRSFDQIVHISRNIDIHSAAFHTKMFHPQIRRLFLLQIDKSIEIYIQRIDLGRHSRIFNISSGNLELRSNQRYILFPVKPVYLSPANHLAPHFHIIRFSQNRIGHQV